MIKRKDPELQHTKISAMSKYYAQYTQDSHVKETDACGWTINS